MDAATLSLGALLIVIIVNCTIRLHVGFLAISLAWIVGVYIDDISAREVMAGFPTRFFLTLAGVTLLFSQAQANGTLDLIAHKVVRLCKGNVGPGLGLVGPMANYAHLHPLSKLVLTGAMWVGRLEILTVLALLRPEVWRSAHWRRSWGG